MSETIWQVATVVAAAPGKLRLAFDPLSACNRCLRGEGCGAGVFSRLFSRRHAVITLEQGHGFSPGQKIRVGVVSSDLVLAALMLYGLPLIAFLGGALAGHALVNGELARDMAALAGGLSLAVAGFMVSRAVPVPGLNPKLETLSCISNGCDA